MLLGSLDHYSCEEALEDTLIDEQQLFELSLVGLELVDDENWSSSVQIHLVLSSPPPCFIDHCIQIGEHVSDRLNGFACPVDSDNMNGQPTWDSLVLEMLWH